MQRIITTVSIALVFMLGGVYLLGHFSYREELPTQPTKNIELKYKTDTIALSPELVTGDKLDIGLMNRDKVPTNGMLFDFEKVAPRSFTMFHTKIPLKALWLDENYRVIGQTQMSPCPSWKSVFCPTYDSPEPVRYVLEVNAETFE